MYTVWSRKRTGVTDGRWSQMPYRPCSHEHCERIIEYYEQEWGNMYSYRIVPTHSPLDQQMAWA